MLPNISIAEEILIDQQLIVCDILLKAVGNI